ncbi:nicotinate-nucleotide--dimethylbenzimidazole phosphoribosyltransferase [Trichloromonas sp.]|uniref:nicotinate-nucleotide--dimethylbenzimidazole phosphoribosyltransferase n=1 Tax=Trichloromonas sp. TaxID=3069249 RepID=UPI001DE12D6C|nr:nicotinate-nucleotide--dimethylbenzimidazole phosphoribosyltransferase [Desulfuromonadaceae bacterium]MDY0269866.1 nicotinate-nucleotide--dimethylbenzimidazole phosphoribosyltransferase [Trichloromonas sp.]
MTLLQDTIDRISGGNANFRKRAKERLDQLIMPHWALGRVMDLALDLAAMTDSMRPPVVRKRIVVMAADHGIIETGVSLFPAEVTLQMMCGFLNGHAGINVLARQSGTDLTIVDMGVAGDISTLPSERILHHKVAAGTRSFAEGPAMSRDQAIQALEAGITVALELAAETDIFGTGDMGIGNTSPSSAIVACLCRKPVEEVTGRGTGLDDKQLQHKIEILEKAISLNRPDADDPIDVLSKVGGFEIAGIAGLILGAAALRKPVVVDGFISTAAALVASRLAPLSRDFMIAAHRSVEYGQVAALADLGKEPLLDLNFRLGEGTGAALAMNLVEAAVAVLTEMATFDEAAVSRADK